MLKRYFTNEVISLAHFKISLFQKFPIELFRFSSEDLLGRK